MLLTCFKVCAVWIHPSVKESFHYLWAPWRNSSSIIIIWIWHHIVSKFGLSVVKGVWPTFLGSFKDGLDISKELRFSIDQQSNSLWDRWMEWISLSLSLTSFLSLSSYPFSYLSFFPTDHSIPLRLNLTARSNALSPSLLMMSIPALCWRSLTMVNVFPGGQYWQAKWSGVLPARLMLSA